MSKQQSLSSFSRKCSTEPTLITSTDKIKKKKTKLHNLQKNPRTRSPLHDFLNIPISSFHRSNSNSSNLSSSSSSSISIEAPSGCLNFFSKTPLNVRPRNRHKPKFLSKNPKSAPNPLQFKENGVTHKSKESKSGRLSGSIKTLPKVKNSTDFDNPNSGEFFNFPGFVNASPSDNLVVEDCTPVGKLVSSGSVLKSGIGTDDCKFNGERSNTSGTPPVQSSLSPEIQCGSNVLVSGATPSTATCYGAGHVVSGITDRRKCRPRGTLIVGTSQSSECPESVKDVFDGISDENPVGVVRKSRPSFIPLPAEASMSWNLSPSQEEEGGSMNGGPSLPCRFDSNMFRYANRSGTGNSDVESGRKTRITLLSPCTTPILKQEERTISQHNFTSETSPFSLGSLDSGNVIRTPNSDSSKERQLGRSWLNEVDVLNDSSEEYELDSVSELLQQASLSPWSQTPPSYPSSKLANLTSPNNTIAFNQVQKKHDIRVSCFSNSTFEDVSPSHMRISWRDGLVSRIFETDDLDSCRLLSDEENEADGCGNELLKSHPPTNIFTFEAQNDDGLRSPEFLEREVEVDRKGKAVLSRTNSCAESIFTDGGGLVDSGDADWTLCYKNHLFEV